MKVVIVGDRTRETAVDVALVNDVIDKCKAMYPKLRIITKECDRGIGKSIKKRLYDSDKHLPREIDWTELSLRHYLVNGDLPRMEYSLDYDALNSALLDLGDEFHILPEDHPGGVMLNLMRRVRDSHRSYSVYKLGETDFKKAGFFGN